MWRIVDYGRLAAVVVAVAGLVGFAAAPTAQAADTNSGVTARVCSADTAAQMTLTAPQSDSTVTTSQVTVSGQVANVSSIEVYLNNTRVRTVAIPANGTSFSTSVTLATGTSTIRVVGQNVCGGPTVERTAVVTYRAPTPPPPTPKPDPKPTPKPTPTPAPSPAPVRPTPIYYQPSYGSQIPTVVDPDTTDDQVSNDQDELDEDLIDDDATPETPQEREARRWRVFNDMVESVDLGSVLAWFGEALDLNVAPATEGSIVAAWWPRALGILLGLIALIGGAYLLGFWSQVRDMDSTPRRIVDLTIRAIGLILIVLSFILL